MSYSELVIPFVSPGEVLSAGIVIPLVGILTVGLRFWLRSRQKARAGADDYLILLALVIQGLAWVTRTTLTSGRRTVVCSRTGYLSDVW